MTITINGTTGITNDGGYTGDGVVFADTTPANTLVTTTGGNVGIGTNAPTAKLVTNGPAQFIGSGAVFPTTGCGVEIVGAPNGSPSYIQAYNRDNSTWQQVDLAGSVVSFRTGGTERARIDVAGNVGIATNNPTEKLTVSGNAAILDNNKLMLRTGNQFLNSPSSNEISLVWNAASDWRMVFQGDRNVVVYSGATAIWSAGTGTSDARLKENVSASTKGLDVVSALNVVDFSWKPDSALADGGKTHTGFLAQEVKKLVPDAVKELSGTFVLNKEELVPFMVKAIQEQQAIITALTARVAALDARLTSLEGK